MSSFIIYIKNFLKNYQKTNNSLNDVRVGEGAIVEINNRKVAAYKKSESEIIKLSPVCTHLACPEGIEPPTSTSATSRSIH